MEAAARSHGLLLDQFPTDVLAQILAFTSPLDAARSSVVSHNFRSAAASDVVWDRFLPPDIGAILSRAIAPVEFPSKKDLFLRLSARPILIDGGDASFALERSSGKKCLMLSARQLRITWGNDDRYWTFTPTHESRFGEVAELLAVWWFDLSGVIATTSLSPRATYGAFLVFQLREHVRGRVPLAGARSVGPRRSSGGGNPCGSATSSPWNGSVPRRCELRGEGKMDGWRLRWRDFSMIKKTEVPYMCDSIRCGK